jgi:hypothetical protein
MEHTTEANYPPAGESPAGVLEVSAALPIILELWCVSLRANRNEATPPSVLSAIETALERVSEAGFEFRDMIGEPYNENMRIRVVHQDGGDLNIRISECLSPAVYYNKALIKPAEVVLRGDS